MNNIKKYILSILLIVFKVHLRIIYFFIKLFTTPKDKVVMLSRQSNEINIDFIMLQDEIKKQSPNTEIKIMCKKIPKKFSKKIEYYFYMIKTMHHLATSKVCIVDGYVIPVSILKHKKDLVVVQIWHALGAIKKFGKQVIDKKEGSNSVVANIMDMHKNYTFVTCASKATREFYAEAFGVEKEKIFVLGMPRIDYLLDKENKISEKIGELLKEYPKLKEKRNILYVPTFRKGKSTPVNEIIKKVDNAKYNLIIRLHPLEKTNVDKDYIVDSKYSTFDLLKIADYVITDYSAIAFETAVIDKPIFFYLYDLDEYENNRGLNINLKKEMKSVTFNNINDIISVIEKDKYPYEEYQKFKDKYIETKDTNNSKRIIEKIKCTLEEVV